jgi:hypothetical protein
MDTQKTNNSNRKIKVFSNNNLIVFIIIIGSFLRIYRLGYKSLWVDEGITWALAKYHALSHGHPQLYFIIVGFFIRIFGENEFGLRLFSAVSGIGVLITTYFLTKKIFDYKTAYLATLFLALSPVAIFSSQNARMYPTAALGMLISSIFFFKAIENNKIFTWILFSVFNAINMLIEHFTLFPLIAYFIFLIIFRRKYIKLIKRYIYSGIISVLLFSFDLSKSIMNLSMMTQGGYTSKFMAISLFPLELFKSLLYITCGYIGYPIGKSLVNQPHILLYVIFAYIIFATLLIQGIISAYNHSDFGICLIVTVFLTFFLQTTLSGNVSYKLHFVVVVAVMLMSKGFFALKRKFRYFILTFYLLILFMNLCYYYNLEYYPNHHENWRLAAKYLDEHAGNEDLIFTTGNRNGLFTLRYYMSNKKVETACRTLEKDLLADYDYERTKIYDRKMKISEFVKRKKNVWILYEDWGITGTRIMIDELMNSNPGSSFINSFGNDLELFKIESRVFRQVHG